MKKKNHHPVIIIYVTCKRRKRVEMEMIRVMTEIMIRLRDGVCMVLFVVVIQHVIRKILNCVAGMNMIIVVCDMDVVYHLVRNHWDVV